MTGLTPGFLHLETIIGALFYVMAFTHPTRCILQMYMSRAIIASQSANAMLFLGGRMKFSKSHYPSFNSSARNIYQSNIYKLL